MEHDTGRKRGEGPGKCLLNQRPSRAIRIKLQLEFKVGPNVEEEADGTRGEIRCRQPPEDPERKRAGTPQDPRAAKKSDRDQNQWRPLPGVFVMSQKAELNESAHLPEHQQPQSQLAPVDA